MTVLKPVSFDHVTSFNYDAKGQGMCELIVDVIRTILCLVVSPLEAWERG